MLPAETVLVFGLVRLRGGLIERTGIGRQRRRGRSIRIRTGWRGWRSRRRLRGETAGRRAFVVGGGRQLRRVVGGGLLVPAGCWRRGYGLAQLSRDRCIEREDVLAARAAT